MPPIVANETEPDESVSKAHAAFRSTANRRLRSLLAVGVESSAASSQLLDDLIAPQELADPPHPQSPLSQAAPHSSSSSAAVSSSGSGAGPSLQQVVACTGTNPTQAKKILLLREEISRLRRDGHSTATVIEQLRGRLRDVRETQAQGWSDEEAENAEVGGGSWRDVKGGTPGGSKRRRVGANDDAHRGLGSGIDLSSDKSYATLPENARPHGGYGGRDLSPPVGRGGAYPPSYLSEQGFGDLDFAPAKDKRHREEAPTPLSQLKKLKLRTQHES